MPIRTIPHHEIPRCLGQRLFLKTSHSHSKQYTWLNFPQRLIVFPFCFLSCYFTSASIYNEFHDFLSGIVINPSIHPGLIHRHVYSQAHFGSQAMLVWRPKKTTTWFWMTAHLLTRELITDSAHLSSGVWLSRQKARYALFFWPRVKFIFIENHCKSISLCSY